MARVLITDGEQRSSLAVVRSLGRAGHEPITVSARARPLAGASRYAAATHLVPDPRVHPSGFAESILRLSQTVAADVLLPMTDVSAGLLLALRDDSNAPKIPFPSLTAYSLASDKRQLLDVAASAGVPHPRSLVVDDRHQSGLIREFADSVEYPIILKPARSAVLTERGVEKFNVRAVPDLESALRVTEELPDEAFPLLVQERIEGPGLGGFMLFHNGEVLAAFGHKRLREKPPGGGVSVYRESIRLREDVRTHSERLLRALDWEGVAMVEFKEDARTGIPYLMEINARFWGSLQLAVDAGVDFPKLLIAAALGEPAAAVTSYRSGVRSRWLWGEADHLIALLRMPKGYRDRDPSLPSKLGGIARLLPPWRPGDRFEVLRASDPMPFVRESAQWVHQVLT